MGAAQGLVVSNALPTNFGVGWVDQTAPYISFSYPLSGVDAGPFLMLNGDGFLAKLDGATLTSTLSIFAAAYLAVWSWAGASPRLMIKATGVNAIFAFSGSIYQVTTLRSAPKLLYTTTNGASWVAPDAMNGAGGLNPLAIAQSATAIVAVGATALTGGTIRTLVWGIPNNTLTPTVTDYSANLEAALTASGMSTYGHTAQGVAYGAGVWCVLVLNASVYSMWTSADLVTWTQRTSFATAIGGATAVTGNLAFLNGKFIAMAINSTYTTRGTVTSTDGITWTASTSLGTALAAAGAVINNSYAANTNFVYINGNFYIGYKSYLAKSTDGITWTATAPFTGRFLGTNANMAGAAITANRMYLWASDISTGAYMADATPY